MNHGSFFKFVDKKGYNSASETWLRKSDKQMPTYAARKTNRWLLLRNFFHREIQIYDLVCSLLFEIRKLGKVLFLLS